MTQATTINKLRKAIEVLESDHVSNVQVALEYETDWARFYSVFTRHGFEVHRYTVRLGEDSEGNRWGHCNCPAGTRDMVCRHIIRAAEVDSDKYGIPLHFDTVAGYTAHLGAMKRAA